MDRPRLFHLYHHILLQHKTAFEDFEEMKKLIDALMLIYYKSTGNDYE